MADYSNRVVTFIKRDTDVKLQTELFNIQMKQQQMIDVISIQKVGSFWYAWYYMKLDLNSLPSSEPGPKVEKPKRGRRKKVK